MKINAFIVVSAVFTLVACGPKAEVSAPENASKAAAATAETLPTYDSAGVISAVKGSILTLDHEGASAAQLAPGRDDFVTYADVVAEAPLTPGQRVTFKFRKTKAGLELSELKAR